MKAFKCKNCDYKTTQKGHLKKHIESVHEGIKPANKFKCNICDYETVQNSKLKKHINSVHEGINKLWS